MNKKQKISKFLQESRTDCTSFIRELDGGVSSLQAQENQKIREKKEDKIDKPKASNYYMENGIYGEIVGQPPYQEMDFEKFSFKILKHLSNNQDLNETVSIIESFPRTDTRKRLRIQLFESLKDAYSPYFDIELYYDIKRYMVDTLDKVEKMIQDKGYEILTKRFDSFSFIATDEQARKLLKQINSELEISKLTLEKKPSVVKFYNIAHFMENGGWYEAKTTGTDYDSIKVKIIEALKEKNFSKAYKAVKQGREKHGESDKLKEYVSEIRKIQQEVEKQ